MKEGKARRLLYLLPYVILLLLGAWYRMHSANVAFLDGDSEYYILPPWLKELTSEWHKGERPMPYLEFIHFTLRKGFVLAGTVAWQKALAMVGAGFLVAAWVKFVDALNGYKVIWHLLGYLMLAIYISSPELMYYEQLLGPEALSMCIMCLLIFCLTVAFSNSNSRLVAVAFGACIFGNLYLAAPMPKWVFASLLLELILVFWVIMRLQLSRKNKFYLLLVPHLLYLFLYPTKNIPTKLTKHRRIGYILSLSKWPTPILTCWHVTKTTSTCHLHCKI